MPNLQILKDLIFESDNKACFIERERILPCLEKKYAEDNSSEKYAKIFADLLDSVSTPVLDCDFFAGRVVEEEPDPGMSAPCGVLYSIGHMSYDYETLLKKGISGILRDMENRAEELATESARRFVYAARLIAESIKRYAERYAATAAEKGLSEMARALSVVPYRPAYDFYSALQSVWLIHMIASCYVGSRDYAFGRFDRYMFPYYEQALREGKTEEELIRILAGFLIKTNEICGRATHNYKHKPIPSNSSKQYLTIGGDRPNAFSSVVLRAAELSDMAQPTVTVLLKPEADLAFTDQVFHTFSRLSDKMNVYNYEVTHRALLAKGLPEEVASDFTFSGCCALDLHYHTIRNEQYVPSPVLFLTTLHEKEYRSVEEILRAFRENLRVCMQEFADRVMGPDCPERERAYFFDSLFLSDTAKNCQHAAAGRAPYYLINFFHIGAATIGDSFAALDRLVFQEKRFSYAAFMKILDKNYEGNEALRTEIFNMVRFGNDDESVDRYTVLSAEAFAGAVDDLILKPNFFAIPSIYTLERDNTMAEIIGATPDGRHAGDPVSENQSPVYGADRKGITALLRSLARYPFERMPAGGLNLSFSKKHSPEMLKAIVLSYFEMGGLHAGISFIDRETLQDAMENPEKYKSLTVRLYGFSEYFINLPLWQQIAVLNRTAYE